MIESAGSGPRKVLIMFHGSPELIQAIREERLAEAESYRLRRVLQEEMRDERPLSHLKSAVARVAHPSTWRLHIGKPTHS